MRLVPKNQPNGGVMLLIRSHLFELIGLGMNLIKKVVLLPSSFMYEIIGEVCY